MSSFTTPLIVKIHTIKPQEREIFTPFKYTTEKGDEIIVPKGFFTNFASTPRILWFILPPLDYYGKAAVVHDYLYMTPGLYYTRKEADDILREACDILKVKKWKTLSLYYTVRLFGFRTWNKHHTSTGIYDGP